LYLPATHLEHGPPSGPDQPELQVQFAKAVLCAGELESATHMLHSVGPTAFLYLPAPQAVHVPPSGPDHPALQVQCVIAMLAVGETE
jgi:hypothetical protein